MQPQRKRLVVNADDFGRSPEINTAIIRAHREGILTTASLMVNEPGSAEAVRLAKENPRLGVGLHLSLLCGRSALPFSAIPGLVDANQQFSQNPTAVGFRYFFNPKLKQQLKAEIEAQFQRFRKTGLPLDHLNGHLHLHLHPVVLDLVLEMAPRFGVRHMRLTREPWQIDRAISRGNWLYRGSHSIIFSVLSSRAATRFARQGLRHTDYVFGLLQNDRVHTPYLLRLLPRLPDGISELYSHPSLDNSTLEFEALISPQVRDLVRQLGIQLIRYQDFQ